MRLRRSIPSKRRSARSTRYSYAAKNRRPGVQQHFLSAILILLLLGIGVRTLEGAMRTPEAVLVLGGAAEREVFAAQFAKENPGLPVWVSSGSNPEYAEWVFLEAGIDAERLHLDYQAIDTVTNFTTLVDEFQARGIQSVYLITSDYHMRRAKVIGEIVFGSHGITFKPIAVPSQYSPEPWGKVFRDAVRSITWVVTGRTGASLAQAFYRE
jgi:uncharacterized SAM-binding protein YcdF (DUF218 family)